MDRFKCSPGVGHIYPIDTETVEGVLGKKRPYYAEAPRGSRYFAVCPVCDNPIQIVAIFKKDHESGRKPYGKHYGHSIPNLALYNEEAYRHCPYHRTSIYAKPIRRPPSDSVSSKFLTLLRDQFDRVIYILQQDTGIHISEATARHMIRAYIGNKGWEYYDSSLNNLPWKFAHAEKALPLFGRFIKNDSELARAIETSCPEVELVPAKSSGMVKVQARNHQYVDLLYYFCHHRCRLNGDELIETIKLRLYRSAELSKTVFEKTIPIRGDYFMNLIAAKNTINQRSEKWLRIAREEINLPDATQEP